MNKLTRILVVLSVLLTGLLAFPTTVHAQSGPGGDDQLVLGESYTLKSGQVQEGSVIVFGGTVKIEEGARVNGDIFVAGGSLNLQGEVQGAVSTLGSVVAIGDTAVLESDLSTMGGSVDLSKKAVVKGSTNIGSGVKTNINRPQDFIKNLPNGPVLFDMGPINDVFGSATRAIGMALLAALVILFMLRPTERVAQTAFEQPVLSFFMGLLTVVVAPALIVLLIITLILSPLGLLGIILLMVASLFGWIAVSYEIGKRVAASLKVDWAPPVVAGLGTLLLTIASELLGYVFCIGWILPTFVSLMGLGAVMISRFGFNSTNPTPPARPVMPTPPTPPTPPVPPTSPTDWPRQVAGNEPPPPASSSDDSSNPVA